MKFTSLLTIVFITLKLLEKIDWSWWLVVSPTLFSCLLWLAVQIWWESKTPIEKTKYIMKKKYGL